MLKDMFIHKDFMLLNDYAKELYHQSAENLPIIDYHCHLSPELIAKDYMFPNISQLWLGGDHYKWRAMRGNGITEDYITGNRSDYEKFQAWASTVPYTMRNPLYHWTHLELKRVFGIDTVLNEDSAAEIYKTCNEMLQTEEFRVRALLEKFKVEVVCTTDDPVDSLEYHRQIAADPGMKTKVYPTWRPDKLLAIEQPAQFIAYIKRLSEVSDTEIRSFSSLLDALEKRQEVFAELGCRLSDHGLDNFYAENYTESEIENAFSKLLSGKTLDQTEAGKYKSAILYELAAMNARKGWAQQYHISVIRNNCSRMFKAIGPDTGFDAILEVNCSVSGHRFFDRLDKEGLLAKTILYSLNPKDFEVLATMAYTFNEGPVPGKMQLGAAWWFLDQEDGMLKQLNALSSLGLLSRFTGMLTDSRSFISYPRHEYFRRILCNLIGTDLQAGKLPASELDFIKQMVADICYYNAKRYFNFK